MRQTLRTFLLTLAALALIDLAAAGALGWAAGAGRLGGLVAYFDYGRSVPGKLAAWDEAPDAPGNLADIAWRPAQLAASAEGFAAEDPGAGPVLRAYGMSFTSNILAEAEALDPALSVDRHDGPSAPPNFTFAQFLDDRPNRRAGDVVVLGILSSSLPAMAALSNQTWAFEQPAPFTYPVFLPEGDGLARIEPVIETADEARDPALAGAWRAQLREVDAFHAPVTFGATWADASPFLRLVRRSLAKRHIARVERRIEAGELYPVAEVLPRMIAAFAAMAREDGQVPVVLLIQGRDGSDLDLLALTAPVLEREGIPYLATAEIASPSDPANFAADSHYRPEVDRRFAEALLRLLP
ncbi:hypothetical protein [Pseudoroseicyclus sp. CXY001]|uniref:hypothetical protein n=1 Tax=Pseudoroseicyclus sp. CXY001 TaxID=3242492 RepID=UPI003570E897